MKITKKKLIALIAEELSVLLEEQSSDEDEDEDETEEEDGKGGYESPRDAHVKGSKYAGAGKFIGKGGKKAFRKVQCRKSWKIHGQWVHGMQDCAKLLASDDGEEKGNSSGSANSSNQSELNSQRLDTIERRLRNANIA